ncbi:MAG TPA: thioredoxin domain-containing protein [Gemmatimonadales bacterium]|nr:thioredoxin domain-containing protein [Gemmatimonadales bacterium]
MRRILVFLIAFSSPALAQQTDPVATRSKGRADAPVTVYEMADFQCPVCRQFTLTVWPTIEREYVQTGKVRWVFVNFPLTRIHPNAVAAAQVAMCAARQAKFWPVHDKLYQSQPQWAPQSDPGPTLLAVAESAGVDRHALESCVESKATLAVVDQDAQGAMRSGAGGTPDFYIEGGLLDGAVPVDDFRHILDSVYLAKSGPTPAPRR